jgi:hypothetical protein
VLYTIVRILENLLVSLHFDIIPSGFPNTRYESVNHRWSITWNDPGEFGSIYIYFFFCIVIVCRVRRYFFCPQCPLHTEIWIYSVLRHTLVSLRWLLGCGPHQTKASASYLSMRIQQPMNGHDRKIEPFHEYWMCGWGGRGSLPVMAAKWIFLWQPFPALLAGCNHERLVLCSRLFWKHWIYFWFLVYVALPMRGQQALTEWINARSCLVLGKFLSCWTLVGSINTFMYH